MANAGYSNTPLAKKLGFKEGFKIRLINQPDHYFNLFSDLPENLIIINEPAIPKDLIHYFCLREKDLKTDLPDLKNEILSNGIIWVSWPKKAAKVKTDITEDIIRNYALSIGLVDVKVCAVDETWSGLKLVIPLKDRKAIL